MELSEEDDRYQVARIGDPDVTLPVGEHVYEISYDVRDLPARTGVTIRAVLG
ncbi:MAG: hypothetical protein Q7J48_18735 [Nocardioides sp.]|nr:hypothetical protein [Nocardioides sp.]